MGEESSMAKLPGTSLKRREFLKKSGLAVLGSALTAGLLAACGDNTSTTVPAASSTTAAGGTATTAAAGAATTAAAGAATTANGAPIKVGVLITFTGPYTAIG